MTKDEARAALRVARKLYDRDRAKFLESEYNRERTAFLASEAGISDLEVARCFDMPRETARRMRVRHQARLGMGTPDAVVRRRPGGPDVARFPRGRPDLPTGSYPTGVSVDDPTGVSTR